MKWRPLVLALPMFVVACGSTTSTPSTSAAPSAAVVVPSASATPTPSPTPRASTSADFLIDSAGDPLRIINMAGHTLATIAIPDGATDGGDFYDGPTSTGVWTAYDNLLTLYNVNGKVRLTSTYPSHASADASSPVFNRDDSAWVWGEITSRPDAQPKQWTSTVYEAGPTTKPHAIATIHSVWGTRVAPVQFSGTSVALQAVQAIGGPGGNEIGAWRLDVASGAVTQLGPATCELQGVALTGAAVCITGSSTSATKVAFVSATGQTQTATYPADFSNGLSVSMSTDGLYLVRGGSGAGSLRGPAATYIARFGAATPTTILTNASTTAMFLPDGRFILGIYQDSGTSMWTVRTTAAPTRAVATVAIPADGEPSVIPFPPS